MGNVALKSSEGVARMLAYYMKQEFSRNLFTKIAASISGPVIKSFYKKIDPGCYNGASLVGLQGIVIKSHGSADIPAFVNAIREAILTSITMNKKDVPQRIGKQLESLLVERRAV